MFRVFRVAVPGETLAITGCSGCSGYFYVYAREIFLRRARVKNTLAYTSILAEHPEHPEQPLIHAPFSCSGYPEQRTFCPEQNHFSAPSLIEAENRAQQSVIQRVSLASVGRTVPWLTMAAIGG